MKTIRWYIWILLIVASIPAALDVGVFLISLTPFELYKVDAFAVESILFDNFRYNFSLWRTLSMLVLEFTAIQAALVKRFRRDNSQSPWVLLVSSLRQKRLLITPGQYFKLWREELLQKIVWLCFGFLIVFLSRVNRNNILLYNGLAVSCVAMALLWKTKVFWRHKDATKHYALAGGIQFITVTALSWHYGIPAGIIAYIISDVLLVAFLLVVWLTIKSHPQPEQTEAEDATLLSPSKVNIALGIDGSGSVEGYEKEFIEATRLIVDEYNDSGLDINVQLYMFGTSSDSNYMGIDIIKSWCPVAEMARFVELKLHGVYQAEGNTPLNGMIVRSQEDLVYAPEDDVRMPISITITDGRANDDHCRQSDARNAAKTIEEEMGGVCVVAGVGRVSESYLEDVTTAPNRYKIFRTGQFQEAAKDIVGGTINVTKHGREAEFFYLA